jgi:hypothetical protein
MWRLGCIRLPRKMHFNTFNSENFYIPYLILSYNISGRKVGDPVIVNVSKCDK